MKMEIVSYIYEQCAAIGMTKAGICALLANIQKESLFIPNNLEDSGNRDLGMTDEQYTVAVDSGTYTKFASDGYGYGLPQLTFHSRKQAFLDFVKARGGSIGDYKLQVAYIIHEMKTSFWSVFSTLCTSEDLYACTWLLLDKWENPREKTENMKERYVYAQEWFNYFSGKGGKPMTQSEAIQKVLNLARSEIGYHEKASNANLDDKTANSGSGNWTKYAKFLDSVAGFYNGKKNGFAWCDVFVDYLFVTCFGTDVGRQMVCQPYNSAGAGCLYSAQYYKNAGRWTNQPQAGHQIFFSQGSEHYVHTGIVESVEDGVVYTIEGNTSDQVARRSYSVSSGSIDGYGVPKWDLASGSSESAPSTPNAQNKVSVLKKGASGSEVCNLQENLIYLGYNLGAWGADGDYGADTVNAVIKFQRDHGLVADGEYGPATKAALEAAVKKKMEGNQSQKQEEQVQSSKPAAEEKPAQQAKQESTSTSAGASKYNVGEKVTFIGKGFYLSPTAKFGLMCRPGPAVIRAISVAGKTLHPYRLAAVRGGGSTVNGWVDADTIFR